MTFIKNTIFNEYDSISDKLKILNNNDKYIKEFANRIERGSLLSYTDGISSMVTLSTSDTTVLDEDFWVKEPDRLISIETGRNGYIIMGTGGYNQAIWTFEIDGVQVFQYKNDLFYNVTGLSTGSSNPWSYQSFVWRAELPGQYNLKIKVKKDNSSTSYEMYHPFVLIRDVGKYIEPES